jgi:hypothetical protein
MEDYAFNWQVLLVIVFLVGLLASVIKPILKLNSTLTRLDTTLISIQNDSERRERENIKEHDEFNERLDEHEDILVEHDKSICELRYRIDGR